MLNKMLWCQDAPRAAPFGLVTQEHQVLHRTDTFQPQAVVWRAGRGLCAATALTLG